VVAVSHPRFSELLSALGAVRQGSQWVAKCPAHDDDHPSLSITEKDGRILLHDFAKGCAVEDIVAAIGWELRDLFTKTAPAGAVSAGGGLTLDVLAEAKHLDAGYLRGLGLRDVRRMGVAAVAIPYCDRAGEVRAMRYRLALEGPFRFVWRKGDKTLPYGLPWLSVAREQGWLLMVEGESDCWTCWAAGLPALGVPGKATWKGEWADLLEGVPPDRIYIWVEPEAEDFAVRIGRWLREARVIRAPEGTKDPSEAHIQGQDLPVLLERLKAASTPVADAVAADDARREAEREARLAERAAAEVARLREAEAEWTAQAHDVLDHDDPLALVRPAIVDQRYGGDLRPAVLVYLAATSRVLKVQRGGMLSHLLLIGPPSAGKSYTVNVVLSLFPAFAHHEIDAGSPKVLIYDTEPLSHRVVVFGEADSLPSGEDNPAASAIRNLLQDGYLHYQVVTKEEGTAEFVVQEVTKPGPTVLFTTAVRQLGGQLMSRLFELEVPDDQEQVRGALAAQARLELEGATVAPTALIAYQSLLQLGAPWDVVVPFAAELATHVGRSPAASRILRDYARLLSLIKAVAVLRHRERERDGADRLVATVEDYTAVYDLVADTYTGSATGAGEKVRAVVRAVAALREGAPAERRVSAADVAKRLGVNRMAATRRVQTAVKGKWLVNRERAKGAPYDLVLGDPLPEDDGLPTPNALRAMLDPGPEPPVTPRTPGNNGLLRPVPDGGNAVTAPTGGRTHPPSPDAAATEGGGGVDPPVNGVTPLHPSGGDGNTPLLRPVQGVTAPVARSWCPYPQHAPSDYRRPDGGMACGVCHPSPATAGAR
jgi:hypothetical protein